MASPYSRWQDALFAQMRLLDWYQTPEGLAYLGGFYQDMNDKTTPEGRRDARTLAAIHVKTLIEAEPIWVAAESVELVDHARQSFEPEPVLPNDPFVPAGFALLGEPIMLRDAPFIFDLESATGRSRNGFVPVRAIAWMPVHNEDATQGCFWIHTFVHVDDEVASGAGPLGEESMPPEQLAALRRIGLMVGHTFQWSWHQAPWRHPEGLDVPEGENPFEAMARAREQSQLVQTLWRIGSQFVPARIRAERQQRRQAKRRKMPNADEVTLIRLRRSREYGDHEESGRELSVQFLVRGYWAKRHTREGPRQVWVRPHIKGPANAPFRESKRAWEFTR